MLRCRPARRCVKGMGDGGWEMDLVRNALLLIQVNIVSLMGANHLRLVNKVIILVYRDEPLFPILRASSFV